jgi:putative peptidoglycan lipid II flippase
MRLVVYLAIPASVGLAVIGEPLARLLFERGEFTAADTLRTSRMIVAYAIGVPALCALPVVIRGYFAMGDFATPVRVGASAVGLNLVLNSALVWPLAELGLALATVATATLHAMILLAVLARRNSAVDARLFLGTFVRSAIASGAMALIAFAALHTLADGPSLTAQLVRVSATVAASVAAYFLLSQLLGGREYRLLSRNSDL